MVPTADKTKHQSSLFETDIAAKPNLQCLPQATASLLHSYRTVPHLCISSRFGLRGASSFRPSQQTKLYCMDSHHQPTALQTSVPAQNRTSAPRASLIISLVEGSALLMQLLARAENGKSP